MNQSSFDAPTIGVGRLLHEVNRLMVPHHQRDYSWSEDEVEQLLIDIGEARATGQDEYFIGLMVLMPGETGELIILDGQQRLATAVLILASIRTWLREHGNDRDADKIQQEYIAQREFGEEDCDARLILNENNNDFFEELVIHEVPTRDVERKLKRLKRYDANRRLLEAILFCRGKVEELADLDNSTVEEAEPRLFGFVKYLRDGVKVVRLTVPTESNAYTVFETLNDRGLELSVLDLAKNHFFGKASRRLPATKMRWTQMMGNLVNVRADDFLKVYWTSRYGRTQKAQLFPKFKSRVRTAKDVMKISADMLEASEQYAALEIADDPVWSDISKEARQRVKVLKLLSAKTVHPVMLSGLRKLRTRELERLLRLLEILIVRFQLIGGGRTGRIEITCAALAVKIFNGDIRSATNAHAFLKDILPNDAEFRAAFKLKQETNNRKVHYIFDKLEIQQRSSAASSKEAAEVEPSESLTVEHVLPKNPGSGWSAVLDDYPEMQDDYTYRLGNMCLLSDVNRDLGDKPFAEKREAYHRSNLHLTQSVADNEFWTPKEIDRRQTQLAKLAVATWRFP